MSKDHKKKDEQLGEPFSTATSKLRRNLLFNLAQQLSLDICYRCREKILSPEEFSIDHKVAWLDSDDPIKNFYDLDNIAFSHRSCNDKSKRYPLTATGLSRYVGVSKNSLRYKSKPWRARISHQGKSITIGYYSSEEEAAKAYDDFAIRVRGEGTTTNKSLGLLK